MGIKKILGQLIKQNFQTPRITRIVRNGEDLVGGAYYGAKVRGVGGTYVGPCCPSSSSCGSCSSNAPLCSTCVYVSSSGCSGYSCVNPNL